MPTVFFGDDLDYYLAFRDGDFASTPLQSWTEAFTEKYRPVFGGLMWILFSSFRENILPYLALNQVLHALSATIVFAIAYRLSRRNLPVSLAVTLVAATSRFALHQVTQVVGLVEGFALIFFLATLYCTVRAYDAKEFVWRWGWLAVAASFLTIHTHERYIGLPVWLSLAFIFLPTSRFIPLAQWITLPVACIGTVVFNALAKTLIVQMPFFVGTGGTHIGIDYGQIQDHMRQAFWSMFGFNEGPTYLVGAELSSLDGFPAWTLASAFTLAWSIAILVGVYGAVRNRTQPLREVWQKFYWPLMLLMLAAVLLLPSVSTIRLEQRWLLAPFILLLLLFAWAAGRQFSLSLRRFYMVLSLILAASSFAIDTKIAPHFDNIFFVASGEFATATKRDILGKGLGHSAPTALIANKDHCNWTLQKGGFFRLYANGRPPLYCFDQAESLLAAALPPETQVYGLSSTNPVRLLEVTSDYRNLVNFLNQGRTAFDFLEAFPEGRLSSHEKVSTPSGLGAMSVSWDTQLGSRNSLTIVSGFSYRYDAVSIPDNAEIRFGLSMIYPSAEPARAIVFVQEEGDMQHVLFSQDLKPPPESSNLSFDATVIPLSEYSGKRISITFGVQTPPDKDKSGHWIGFAEPRIVSGDEAN